MLGFIIGVIEPKLNQIIQVTGSGYSLQLLRASLAQHG